MTQEVPKLTTLPDVARAFDISESVLRRILRERGIPPTAMAANVGVYDSKAIARIRYAVNAHQAKLAAKADVRGAR